MTNFARILPQLVEAGVEFVVVGGFAGRAHGARRSTDDLDILYARDVDNLQRIVDALKPLHPYLRGAPPGLPFQWDKETLRRGLNFTLTTDLGDLDLLGEMTGFGTFADVGDQFIDVSMFNANVKILELDALIRAKTAAGRPKDFDALGELHTVLERRNALEAERNDV